MSTEKNKGWQTSTSTGSMSGTMPARSGTLAAYTIPSAAITSTNISGLGYGGGSSGVAGDLAKPGVLILIAEGVHYSLD